LTTWPCAKASLGFRVREVQEASHAAETEHNARLAEAKAAPVQHLAELRAELAEAKAAGAQHSSTSHLNITRFCH